MKPVIHLSALYLLILAGMTLALNVAYPMDENKQEPINNAPPSLNNQHLLRLASISGQSRERENCHRKRLGYYSAPRTVETSAPVVSLFRP